MSHIYAISDTHLSNRKSFAKELSGNEFPGTNSRFNVIIDAIRRCAEEAISSGAEALVIPGDVFNERGILPVAVYNASYKALDSISKRMPALFLSPGNHDFVSSIALHSNEGLNSLYGFKAFANIAHVPTTYETDSFTISIIPFIPSKEETIIAAQTLYKKVSKNKRKFHTVFFHHSFEGAETGPINWKMPYPLTVEDIPPFDGKYSGHIHKHQRVGKDLWYIGAPVHHDAGERHYVPGWMRINDDGTFKHIENKESPRFVVEEICSEKELNKLSTSDYKIIKWTGDENIGRKLKDNYENLRVEIAPTMGEFMVRAEMQAGDSVESMMRKYMLAKKGEIDEKLLQYGLEVWKHE